MRKKYVALILFITIIFSLFTACGNEKENSSSVDQISTGIAKINNSNFINFHFKSESIMESDVSSHGTLDSDITFVKEPYTRYSESLNSYFENNEEKYEISYGNYTETVNGELKQYEKYQSAPNVTTEWKLSTMDDKGAKDLANYYSKELDAFIFMISSNINNFQEGTKEKLGDVAAIKYEGYFTNETAKECIEKYLEESFQLFGSDFKNANPLSMIANCAGNVPVSIWLDEESGNPISIHISMTEAEQFYRDNIEVPSTSAVLKPSKVEDSYITIDVKSITNDNSFPLPEGIPVK